MLKVRVFRVFFIASIDFWSCYYTCIANNCHPPKYCKGSISIRVLHAISFARNDFLPSIQGEQAVRTLLKTENNLQRHLKSMPTPSSRIFFWIPSSFVHFVKIISQLGAWWEWIHGHIFLMVLAYYQGVSGAFDQFLGVP